MKANFLPFITLPHPVFFVEYQTSKCQICSVKFLEQIPSKRQNVLRVFSCCKIRSFSILNIQKLEFSRKINQNLFERPAEREEHPFLYQKLEMFIL